MLPLERDRLVDGGDHVGILALPVVIEDLEDNEFDPLSNPLIGLDKIGPRGKQPVAADRCERKRRYSGK